MRTTVELPPELMRQAKARAATRGESLKALFLRAVTAELGMSSSPREERTQVRLPLFGNLKGKPVHISGEDIARSLALDDEDAVRRGVSRRKK
jgi:hypothetical protein